MSRPHRAVPAATAGLALRTSGLALCTAGLALGTALLTGCGSGEPDEQRPGSGTTVSGPAQPGQTDTPKAAETIVVEDDNFSPSAVTISVGDTVSWHFDGDIPHGVQGIGDKAMNLNSPLLEVGDWSHTFTVPGEYRYLCPIHPGMRGTISVE